MSTPSRRWVPGATLLLSLGLACAGPSAAHRAPDGAPVARHATEPLEITGSWHLVEGDARVGRYTSIPWGFETASYWIEGPTGVILIDTQFLPSAAEELYRVATHVTGKPVELALVLHANPDKFNGTATLQAKGVKVLTSRQIIDLMPDVHERRTAAFYDRYAPDYPAELPRPESFGDQTTTLTAGGVSIEARVMGPGCSEAHVVATFDGHLFAGDLVASRSHSWLEIGKTDQWLTRVAEMAALAPRFVHPGRGPTGGPELLTQQDAYLREVIRIVGEAKPSLPLDDALVAETRAKIEAAFPDYGYKVFLRIGLPAEMERQARAAAAP